MQGVWARLWVSLAAVRSRSSRFLREVARGRWRRNSWQRIPAWAGRRELKTSSQPCFCTCRLYVFTCWGFFGHVCEDTVGQEELIVNSTR